MRDNMLGIVIIRKRRYGLTMKIKAMEHNLTPEGRRMWENLDRYSMEEYENPMSNSLDANGKPRKTRRGSKTVILSEQEFEDKRYTAMRLEIKKMIQNSKWVVADCAKMVELYTKKEMYFAANEHKTAMLIHHNFILRLERILANMTAFENDFEIEEEDRGISGYSVSHDNDDTLRKFSR